MAEREKSSQRTFERQPKHAKPFSLILMLHSVNGVGNLCLWDMELRRQLEQTQSQSPNGQVVAFTESADSSARFSATVTRTFASGKTAEQSYMDAIVEDILHGSTDVDQEVKNKARKLAVHSINEPFRKEELRILTNLQDDYGERVLWIPEYNTDKTIGLVYESDWLLDQVIEDPDPYSTMYWMRNYIETSGELHRFREQQLACIVDATYDNPDVVGGAAVMGTFHSGLGLEVNRLGYRTKRIFADKPKGERTFFYSPTKQITRGVRFHPNRLLTMDDNNTIDKIYGVTSDLDEENKARPLEQQLSDQQLYAAQQRAMDEQGIPRVEFRPQPVVPESDPQPAVSVAAPPNIEIFNHYFTQSDDSQPGPASQTDVLAHYGMTPESQQQLFIAPEIEE